MSKRKATPIPSAEREQGETHSAWERSQAAKRRSDEREALKTSIEEDQVILAAILRGWKESSITSTGAAELLREAGVLAYGKPLPAVAAHGPIDPAITADFDAFVFGKES